MEKIKNYYYNKIDFLLLPALIISILVWIGPFIYQIILSLHEYNLNKPGDLNKFVGLHNYFYSFYGDPYFIDSCLRTIVFTSLCLISEIILGLFGALILFELDETIARKLMSFIIIPMVIAPSAVGLIWYFQFNPDFGPFAIYLNKMKLLDKALLGQDYSFFSISFVDIWEYTPFMILIFYSSLRSIPKSIKESLYLDNVSYFLKLKKVYIGYVLPIFLIAIFLRTTGLLKIFDQIYILTGGGPGTITEMISLYAQRLNYKNFNFGLGAAQGVIINYFFLLMFLLVYKKIKIY